MGRHRRWTACAVLAALHVGALAAAAQGPASVELAIEWRDLARVPLAVTEEAKAEVDRTFHAAGVRIVWVEPGRSMHAYPPMLTLIVVRSSMREVPRQDESGPVTLGLAPTCGAWAQVFYDRVTAAVAQGQLSTSVVLANVIAHELGHLLLPTSRHAPFGLMGEWVALQGPALRRFSSEQARLIRAALVNGPHRHACGRPEGHRLAVGIK